MKKRKNGFTLIELLAVIVILAIIALITTPIIINIIEKSRKSAFMDSAYGLVEAAKLEYTEGLLQNTSTAKSYTFPQTGTDKLEFSGSEPTGGTINVSSNGQVTVAIHDGTWCVTKNSTDSKVTITKYDVETCVLPEEQVVYTPETCFQVADHRKIEYTVNKDVCINYFLEEGYDESDSELYCSGGVTFYGNSLDVSMKLDPYLVNDLEMDGVITVTSRNVDGVTITKYNKNDSACGVDVVIPETIGGEIVKSIGQRAFAQNFSAGATPTVGDNKKINSVVFPSGIESIELHAFIAKYNNLVFNQITKLDFSKAINLQIIGEGSFASNQLTVVDFSKLVNLKAISYGAFMGNELTDLDLSELTNLTEIYYQSFAWNNLTNITMPDSVVTIGGSAFSNNQLTNITIPSRVVAIDDLAFSSNKLTDVTIPVNVISIGYKAFTDNQLTNVTIEEKCSWRDFVTYEVPFDGGNIIWTGKNCPPM